MPRPFLSVPCDACSAGCCIQRAGVGDRRPSWCRPQASVQLRKPLNGGTSVKAAALLCAPRTCGIGVRRRDGRHPSPGRVRPDRGEWSEHDRDRRRHQGLRGCLGKHPLGPAGPEQQLHRRHGPSDPAELSCSGGGRPRTAAAASARPWCSRRRASPTRLSGSSRHPGTRSDRVPQRALIESPAWWWATAGSPRA